MDIMRDFPQFTFVPASQFVWSSSNQSIGYKPAALRTAKGKLALIHEISHALLRHTTYQKDLELIKIEVAAWKKAKPLARRYKITLDEKHIEDSLDTYRMWLYQRSHCPECENTALQISSNLYRCFNCNAKWQVPDSQLCRTRRRLL